MMIICGLQQCACAQHVLLEECIASMPLLLMKADS